MRVDVQSFKLPKAGNSPFEYEDAYWPQESENRDLSSLRLAVADGATETSFSGLWASILVNAFIDGRLGVGLLHDELKLLQERWKKEVEGRPLPWYAEEKLRSGAFATVAGLELVEKEDGAGTWSGFAVGDSCIIQIRGDRLLHSFPLERSEEFDNSPLLISSNQSNNSKLSDAIQLIEKTWNSGDIFYLMTDALACYFLRMWERSDDRHELMSIFNDFDVSTFEKHMNDERGNVSADAPSLLRNDDLTFVRCCVCCL